jgi:NSS family neurotransmitter:Na+ symporter
MSTARNESWTNRAGFVLAATGSAIGLGNVWRFSYVAGENGGGAFLLVYVACVVLIALPILLAEFAMGTRSRGDVVHAFSVSGAPRAWRAGGLLAACVAFLILSYYSVVAGWTLKYLFGYATGAIPALPREAVAEAFATFLRDPVEPLAWHALFMALTAFVVGAGVARGIERANRILLPLLAVTVVGLAAYAVSLPGAGKGLAFLFAPDWEALARPRLYLAALGQTFFSIGVGMGIMITYAAYFDRREQLPSSAAITASGDTLFAIVAGMAVFPVVFAFGLDPAQGPTLAFVTLPRIFAVMPGGAWVGVLFFFLLVAAALTSAVSLLEVLVAIAVRRGARRGAATALVAFAAFALGVPSALGSSVWAEVRLFGKEILDAADFLAANLLLPLAGIAVVLFVGWVLPRPLVLEACGLPAALARAWLALVRYFAPAAIALLLVTQLAS